MYFSYLAMMTNGFTVCLVLLWWSFLGVNAIAIQELDCYNKTNNGSNYEGKKTKPECIKWSEVNNKQTVYAQNHNFCRNPTPNISNQPYCFTSQNTTEPCNVPACDVDCYLKSNNGSSYHGNKTFDNCITWKAADPTHIKYFENHKLCRNPAPNVVKVYAPYCYIQSERQWAFRSCNVPECGVLTKCQQLSPKENQYFTPNSSVYYDSTFLKFGCSSGYELSPNTTYSLCRTDGTWSGTQPDCIGVRCSVLPTIQNASDLNRTAIHRYPDTVEVQCERGYIRNGPGTINCMVDGQWNVTSNCTGVPCLEFPMILNMKRNQLSNDFRYPDLVKVTCENGYILNGSSDVHCDADGRWTTPLPSCLGRLCESFPQIDHSEIQEESEYRFPYKTTITCQRGYFNPDTLPLRCTESGNWTTPPQCIAVPCAIDSFDENRAISPNQSEYRYGHMIRVECKAPFVLSSSGDDIMCDAGDKDNGKWSKTLPACIEKVDPRASSSAGVIGPVVGVALAVLIAGFIIGVCRFRRRNSTPTEKKPTFADMERNGTTSSTNMLYSNISNTNHGANLTEDDGKNYYEFEDNSHVSETSIPTEDFYDYVENGRGEKGKIETEFGKLLTGPQKPTTVAELPGNSKKNKYKNIYAYDETRVIIDTIPGTPDSDYINASFINGYGENKKYIASQGPLTPTVVDWWRMVWQFDCAKVVMLTRVFENGKHKCIQYWPEEEHSSVSYGDIEIKLKKEDVYSEFTMRTLVLTKGGQKKTVIQFHYTAWPDKDVPKYASSLVHFRHKVNNTRVQSKGPIVVHCSAGVGRTGTFIALDYIVNEAKVMKSVDVFKCVETLRRQRVNMVQTAHQYVFLHEAVLESLMCHNSGVSSKDFPEVYQQSLKQDLNKKKTKLRIEFELMNRMGHRHEEEVFARGKTDENRDKNRSCDILPVLSEMPKLSTFVEGHTDYINAVFLPGYKNNKAFIITQNPLQNTVIDFLRLIFDYNIQLIVMVDKDFKPKEKYWPEFINQSLSFGPFNVELKMKETKEQYTRLNLDIMYKNIDMKKVKLLQVQNWSQGSNVPSSVDDVINLISDVEQEREQGGDSPIVIHCLNGCDKSGLFCVISAVIERLRIEQDVDIQHIIKQMRNRRPQIISNYEQYKFLHDTVIVYLKQFETYSNFQ